MNKDIRVFEVVEAKESYVDAVNRLLVQLSSSPVHFTMESLAGIVASPSSHLFFAECNGEVAGMLTLGEYLAPTGRKMWVEDVVVDVAMRGRSIGRVLVEHAMEFSASFNGGVLMLTSRPSRVAANNLYRSCGFHIKETNMYKKTLKGLTIND